MTKNRFIRLISTVIIFSLILSSFAFVQANDEAQTSDVLDASSEIKLLKGLGILDTFETQSQMSRAEFLLAVMIMRGYTDKNQEIIDLSFDDVLPDHKSAGAIKFAVDIGIVDGNAKYFYPDDPADLNFATKILLNAMGYNEIVKARGGYPSGAVGLSVYKDLVNGISGDIDKTLKYEQAVQLLYSALDKNISVQRVYSDTKDIYYSNQKNSMINEYMDLYCVKGKVSANHYASIGNDTLCERDEVIIADNIYKVGTTDISKMIGRYVECYYYADEDSPQKREIIYYRTDSSAKYAKVMYDEIISYKNGVYTYENEKGKIVKARVQSTADLIYNGKIIEANQYSDSLMVPEYGFVELIAKGSGGTYETVSVTSSYNCVVETISVNDRFCAITDRYSMLSNLRFNVDDENITYFIENINADKLTLNDITKNSVLNIVKSIDGSLIKITVSNDRVQGVVNSYSDSEIVLDNNIYLFSKNFSPVFKNKKPVTGGNAATLYFDAYGRVAAAEPTEEIIEYGYLIRAACNGSLDSKLQFRIYNQQGEFVNYTASDSIIIDGQKYKQANYSSALQCFNYEGNFVPQLVKIGFTDNNLIKRIDTAEYGTKEEYHSLSEIPLTTPLETGTYGDIGRKYKTEVKFFDGGAFINDDTTVFLVPKGRFAEEQDYSITGRAYFEGDQYYDIQAYTTDRESVFADVIVCKYYPKYSNELQDRTEDGSSLRPFRSYISLPTAYVTSVDKVLDENGEEATQVTMTSFTTHSDLKCIVRWEDELNNIGPGSVVKYHIGVNGKITFIEKIFDCDTKSLYAGAYINQNTANELYSIRTHKLLNERVIATAYGNNPNIFFATWRMAYLDVISTRENVIKAATCDLTLQSPADNQINFFDGNTFTYVYEYIPEKKKLVETDISAIIPYEADNVNYSKIAVVSRGGTAINAVIILK